MVLPHINQLYLLTAQFQAHPVGKNDLRDRCGTVFPDNGRFGLLVGDHCGVGKPLDEIKQLVKMEKYQSWSQYNDWLPMNIEGMVRQVK